MINRDHLFTGLINGQNIVYDRIRYDIKGLDYRMNFVNYLLKKNDDFLVDYFDNRFVVNPTSWDGTSLENNVCQKLEQLATYLLSEVPEKKSKLEYKFYNGERNFENVLRKEYSLDKIVEDLSKNVSHQTDGDVMYFLDREQNNYYLPKNIKLTPKDFERDDEVGKLLRQYNSLKQNLIEIKEKLTNGTYRFKTNYKLNTFKIKYMLGILEGDMLDCKTFMDKTIMFNDCLTGSNVSCWDEIDFFNPVHIECFLKLTTSPTQFDSDLSLYVNYFNTLFNRCKKDLNKKELEVLKVLTWGNRRVENINDALLVGWNYGQTDELYEIDFEELNQITTKATNLVIKQYAIDLQNFLDMRLCMSLPYNKLEIKICTCCGRPKTISNFQCVNVKKRWYRSVCKKCFYKTTQKDKKQKGDSNGKNESL